MKNKRNFGDKYAAEAFQIAAETPEIEIKIDADGNGLFTDFPYVGLKFLESADDSKLLLMQVRALRAAVHAYHEADAELNGEDTLKKEMKAMFEEGFITPE